MLVVECPPGHEPERRYAIDVLHPMAGQR